jgi:hypothetical protein
VSAPEQARQLRELFDRLDLDPRLRAHLDGALDRAAEAAPPAGGVASTRLVEATGLERERRLRQRHRGADAFLRAWRAGER